MDKQIKDLRNKYINMGYDSLSDFEKIKLLLSYSEKNVIDLNKSAEKILRDYNNIHSEITQNILFSKNKYELTMKSAMLLKLVMKIIRTRKLNRMNIYLNNLKNIKLNSIGSSKKFFHALLHDSYIEKFVIVAVSDNMNIINYEIVSSNNVDKIEISDKQVYQFAKLNKARNIFFAHSHPHGNSKPSDNDIDITLKIKKELDSLNINLIDHIIVGKHNETSLYEFLKNNNSVNDSFKYKKIFTMV